MASTATPSTEALRRVLLPPLRFAAGNDFAGLHRLKGFGDLVNRTLRSVEDDAAGLGDELRALARDFDEVSVEERRARVKRALTLLGGGPDSAPISEATTATEPARGRRQPPPRPRAAESAEVARSKPRRRSSSVDHSSSALPDTRTSRDDVMLWPVSRVRGIGPQRAESFATRGLHTVGDLLAVLPRAYEDRRQVTDLGTVQAGSVAVVSGEILASAQIGGGRGKRWEVLLDDGRGRLKLVFFRYGLAQMKQRFLPGATVTASGEVQRYGGVVQMVHPRVVAGAQTDALRGIWPVYPELGGLPPPELARAIRGALDVVLASAPADPLPQRLCEEANVIPLLRALEQIHAPEGEMSAAAFKALCEHTAPAHRRLAFEELFALSLAMALRRRLGAREPAAVVNASMSPDELASQLLPFSLTGAQRRTSGEICRDMARDEPMARLLQGDVGAGKTAVAALALLQAAQQGMQGTLMAPTELLAEQHRRTLSRWFEPLGFGVELITGSMRAKARRDAVKRLEDGASKIVVGTHALLSDDVKFHRLALCIIDEQHRFGVAQRASLKEKGPSDENGRTLCPHLLVMTATPIPRSLALTLYGDLAVSVLDELPPGRTPVKTRVLDGRGRTKAWDAVADTLTRGQRAYVVYPLIEESEKLDLKDATRGFEELSERFGPERVALVHGRMSSEQRDDTMQRFARGEVHVLVATTVIEVGVDVPEATCMVIANAERFGLSQLHQLRGRVGRGAATSECWLLVGSGGEDARRRLSAMETTNDGFRIAEEDLAIRGPGDFLGTRQSGMPTLLFADLAKHAALLELARELAWTLSELDPRLEAPAHKGLRDLVHRRFRDRIALTGAG